jgi:hypothetical protein
VPRAWASFFPLRRCKPAQHVKFEGGPRPGGDFSETCFGFADVGCFSPQSLAARNILVDSDDALRPARVRGFVPAFFFFFCSQRGRILWALALTIMSTLEPHHRGKPRGDPIPNHMLVRLNACPPARHSFDPIPAEFQQDSPCLGWTMRLGRCITWLDKGR